MQSRRPKQGMATVCSALQECCASVECHHRHALSFLQLGLKDVNGFAELLVRAISQAFTLSKTNPSATLLLKFAKLFLGLLSSSEDGSRKQLLELIISKVAGFTEARDRGARVAVTKFLSEVLNSLPSNYVLDENVVTQVTGKLQNRLLDKHAAVRAWAAKGLRRVVDVDSGERGYPTLTLLKEVLSSESSAEVRASIVSSLPDAGDSLDVIIERTSDESHVVRVTAFNTLAELFSIERFSIRQRVSLLHRGLSDRSPDVRRACGQSLLRCAWLARECEGDVVLLLQKVDVEDNEGVGEMMVRALMEEEEEEEEVGGEGEGGEEKDGEKGDGDEVEEGLMRHEGEADGGGGVDQRRGCVVDWRGVLLERGVGYLLASTEEGPAALSNREGGASLQQLLPPEVALLWRVWSVHAWERMNSLRASAATSLGPSASVAVEGAERAAREMEEVLPQEAGTFVELISMHVEQATKSSSSASERESAQFSARQLMLMAEVIDFADSAARSHAMALLNSLLMSPHGMPDEPSAAAAAAAAATAEAVLFSSAPLQLFGLDLRWRRAVCGMVQVVSGGRQQGLHPLSCALQQAVAALTGVEAAAQANSRVGGGEAEGEGVPAQVASHGSASSTVSLSASQWLHVLSLVEEVAGRVTSGREWRRLCQLQAVDEEMVQWLVVEGVSHPSPIISSKAMGCLGRLCLLLPSLSLSHLPLIVSKAQLPPLNASPAAAASPPTALHLAATQALMDLLMWRGLPAICSAPAHPVPVGRQVMWQAMRELCGVLPMVDGRLDSEAVERMMRGGEEEGGMMGKEGEGEGIGGSTSESDDLMGVLCEGVAKLLVRWPEMKARGDEREGVRKEGEEGSEHGEGEGDVWAMQQKMLHVLLLVYFSPATEDCHRTHQVLSAFFHGYRNHPNAKHVARRLFLPLLRLAWPQLLLLGSSPSHNNSNSTRSTASVTAGRARAVRMGNVLLTLMMASEQADSDTNGGPERERQESEREREREGEAGQRAAMDGVQGGVEEAGVTAGSEGIECSLLESLALELAVELLTAPHATASRPSARSFSSHLCRVVAQLPFKQAHQQAVKAMRAMLPLLSDALQSIEGGPSASKARPSPALSALQLLAQQLAAMDATPQEEMPLDELQAVMERHTASVPAAGAAAASASASWDGDARASAGAHGRAHSDTDAAAADDDADAQDAGAAAAAANNDDKGSSDKDSVSGGSACADRSGSAARATSGAGGRGGRRGSRAVSGGRGKREKQRKAPLEDDEDFEEEVEVSGGRGGEGEGGGGGGGEGEVQRRTRPSRRAAAKKVVVIDSESESEDESENAESESEDEGYDVASVSVRRSGDEAEESRHDADVDDVLEGVGGLQVREEEAEREGGVAGKAGRKGGQMRGEGRTGDHVGRPAQQPPQAVSPLPLPVNNDAGQGSSGGSGSVFYSPAGSVAEGSWVSNDNGHGSSSGVKAARGKNAARQNGGQKKSGGAADESGSVSESVGEDEGSEEERSSEGEENWETSRKGAMGVRGKGRLGASEMGDGGERRQALRQRRQARQVVDDE